MRQKRDREKERKRGRLNDRWIRREREIDGEMHIWKGKERKAESGQCTY